MENAVTILAAKSTCAIVIISLLAAGTFNAANAIGPYPCFFSFEMDKVEYSPGDTVTIKAKHCDPNSTEEATLAVADGMELDVSPESPIWQEHMEGKDVLYKETKKATNGVAEFQFTIPLNSDSYRYMALLSPGSMGGIDIAYFFSKPGASQIVVSDLRLLKSEVKQGEILNFEAKLTDGLGNPLPYLFTIYSSLVYQTCTIPYSGNSAISMWEKSKYEKQHYALTGIVWGWVQVPPAQSDEYKLSVTASTVSFLQRGWADSEPKATSFQVAGSAIPDGLELYAAYSTLNSAISRQEIVIPPPGSNDIASGQIIDVDAFGAPVDYLSARLSHSTCAEPETMPVKVELAKVDFADPRGDSENCFNDLRLCSIEAIDAIEFNESTTAYFGIPPEFVNSAAQSGAGEYMINVTASYHGTTYSNYLGLRMHDAENMRNFAVSVKGKEFVVIVDGWGSAKPENIEFDGDGKKLTATLSRQNESPSRVDIAVPQELLGGNYTVFVNGERQEGMHFFRNGGYSWFSPEISNEDNITIEIIGTSAIPELGSISAALGLAMLIAVALRQKWKN